MGVDLILLLRSLRVQPRQELYHGTLSLLDDPPTPTQHTVLPLKNDTVAGCTLSLIAFVREPSPRTLINCELLVIYTV